MEIGLPMKTLLFLLIITITLSWVWTRKSDQTAPGKPYHHLDNHTFRNPPDSPIPNFSASKFVKFLWGRLTYSPPTNVPPNHMLPLPEALEALKANPNSDQVTWIGHDTFLLRLANKNILTDPFMTARAGVGIFGPKRLLAPGIPLSELPPIDIILVSHNHYDHLDVKTIAALPNKNHIQVIVPLNLKPLFLAYGYTHIQELDWYQSWEIPEIKITALPAIHFSRRGLFDYNRTLWASYAIQTKKQKIYFAGDTAYGPIFKSLGKTYGPFDLGLIPVGAYEPREIMRFSHVNPSEAFQLAKDLEIRQIIGMHWGTIVLTDEPPFDVPKQCLAAAELTAFPIQNLWLMKIGETRSLDIFSSADKSSKN